jgi:hypothetical protein
VILKKKIVADKFAPSLDKDKDIQSGDIIQIISDVRTANTKFGEKQIIEIKLPNEEVRSLWLNQSSISNIIDKYGEDTNNWVDKPMKCLIGLTPNGKTMVILKG